MTPPFTLPPQAGLFLSFRGEHSQTALPRRVLGTHIEQTMADKPNSAGEVVLEALGEGGSLTLLRVKATNGWRFRVVSNEGTFRDLLSEEDQEGIEFLHQSDWVNSFESAVALLNKYRWWHKMYPRQVHPDFRQQIWAAVQNRFADEVPKVQEKWALLHLDRWQSLCQVDPSRPRQERIE